MITEAHVKLNLGLKGVGKMGSFINKQIPTEIVSLWGADGKDFDVLFENLLNNFTIRTLEQKIGYSFD